MVDDIPTAYVWDSKRWYDRWTVLPVDEDFEYDAQWCHHDMPRPYGDWVPEEVFETLHDRVVDEPALAGVFEGRS